MPHLERRVLDQCLVSACAAESTRPPGALRKVFHDIESDLDNRYDHELGDAFEGVEDEWCAASIPQ
jgi:hypothetical protein